MSLSFHKEMGRGPKSLTLVQVKNFLLAFYPSNYVNVALIFIEVLLIWWLEFKVMFHSSENQGYRSLSFQRGPGSTQEYAIKDPGVNN